MDESKNKLEHRAQAGLREDGLNPLSVLVTSDDLGAVGVLLESGPIVRVCSIPSMSL